MYIKIRKDQLFKLKEEEKEVSLLSSATFVAMMFDDYVGNTSRNNQRETGHGCSRNIYVRIKITLSNINMKFKSQLEAIIIRSLNRYNLANNEFNDSQYLLEGFGNEENCHLAFYTLKSAYHSLIDFYYSNDFIFEDLFGNLNFIHR